MSQFVRLSFLWVSRPLRTSLRISHGETDNNSAAWAVVTSSGSWIGEAGTTSADFLGRGMNRPFIAGPSMRPYPVCWVLVRGRRLRGFVPPLVPMGSGFGYIIGSLVTSLKSSMQRRYGTSTRWSCQGLFDLVPKVGVEPTRPHGHTILSRARLPIPPLRHSAEFYHTKENPGAHEEPRGRLRPMRLFTFNLGSGRTAFSLVALGSIPCEYVSGKGAYPLGLRSRPSRSYS